MLVEKDNVPRIPKMYRKCIEICRYFFASLRYFNFSKDIFTENDKTVNLNVRVQRISSNCKAQTL